MQDSPVPQRGQLVLEASVQLVKHLLGLLQLVLGLQADAGERGRARLGQLLAARRLTFIILRSFFIPDICSVSRWWRALS